MQFSKPMKKIIIQTLAVCLLLGGCAVTGRLQKRGVGARADYAPREQKQEPKKQAAPQYIEYKHRDSLKPVYFLPTTTLDDGERVMQLELEEVVVVARSRTIAERMGKVGIDFVIELPHELQGNCRSVAVTPMLHKTDSLVPLQQISIRGGLFSRVQDRNYWQFDQYVRVFKPDAAAEQRAFERFVKHPYPEGVRLDSIVEGRETIRYYYTQEVPTKGEGKTMLVTLEGAVIGLDGSRYDMPPLDTLKYHISSMLTFADTTRRYLTQVIEKYAVVKDRNYLAFEVGKADIIDTLGNNAAQLGRIETLMDGLINQREFYVDSIVLTASASPEGTLALNERLARERALSLKRRLGERFGRQADTLIAVRSVGENWTELGRLIAASDSLPHREAILALFDAEKNPDRREAALRGNYPQEYKYIREWLYPLLRSVDFKYDLRRVGMVKDTIHTTVPDTLYARGVQLLGQRRYGEALTILEPYRDRNYAIALLSLGHDDRAYEVLSALPESAEVCYLKAIACSRLGRREEGRRWFERACELKNTFEYRGRLDPEISNLLTDD